MAGGFDSNRDEREKAINELRDADWDERSSKIEILMHPAPQHPSKRPASLKGIVMVLETMPPWGRVIVMLAIIAASAFGTHRLGWW